MPLRASLDLFDLSAEQRGRVLHRHHVLPAEQLRYLFVKLFGRRHDVFGRHLVENIFQFDGKTPRQPILNRLQFHGVAAIVQLARLGVGEQSSQRVEGGQRLCARLDPSRAFFQQPIAQFASLGRSPPDRQAAVTQQYQLRRRRIFGQLAQLIEFLDQAGAGPVVTQADGDIAFGALEQQVHAGRNFSIPLTPAIAGQKQKRRQAVGDDLIGLRRLAALQGFAPAFLQRRYEIDLDGGRRENRNRLAAALRLEQSRAVGDQPPRYATGAGEDRFDLRLSQRPQGVEIARPQSPQFRLSVHSRLYQLLSFVPGERIERDFGEFAYAIEVRAANRLVERAEKRDLDAGDQKNVPRLRVQRADHLPERNQSRRVLRVEL